MGEDRDEFRRLAALIRENSPPLGPEPPGDVREVCCFPEIPLAASGGAPAKALLFDVYGTLFCSAAGDIGIENALAGEALESLARDYSLTGADLTGYFRRRVLELHAEQAPRTAFPEVRADGIWTDFLREGPGAPAMPEPSGPETLRAAGRELALRYELAVNPVYPMPGALETIEKLRDSGCLLGLISNAQFYTPLLFEAFFGAPPEDMGFEPDLLIYSFEAGEAKPSPLLYRRAAEALARRDIVPEQCLCVGNDMLKDISGAQRAGFMTCLFAGDRRSLRLREGDSRVRGIRPSIVIRDLRDLSGFCRGP